MVTPEVKLSWEVSTELQFNNYFASVQLIVLNTKGFVLKKSMQNSSATRRARCIFNLPCSRGYVQPTEFIKLRLHFNFVCLESHQLHPGRCIPFAHWVLEKTRELELDSHSPELLFLHRAGTASNTCPEIQRTAEFHGFLNSQAMGERNSSQSVRTLHPHAQPGC